ncbi:MULTISPECIES: tryptophan synthase subunit alpha [unclassified Crossiella]|uniref:tryptophan synthase subunit alpha n=1 Tax=unclassified Crossiella TaxID=2620835 RepID=UPI001FFFFFEF|nr:MULTISPECIES: tryptophan synthase subunit alpha [unclassified Crossiella]MCK2241586.1 tryptophan synthase subunit alpha [Crossiella sp. S99.2]MCK2255542.1 tryptophan synthase subunit alpha [Crossiella sp. S99.1]
MLTLPRDRKLLIPYLMGGMSADWLEVARALAAAGADALEIGLPFSDPMVDGPVVQRAAAAALARGATPETVLKELSTVDIDVPLVAMTYANVALGIPDFPARLAEAGVSGVIVSDLPLEESEEFRAVAERAGVSVVLLGAPDCADDRLARICAASRGFVYSMTAMRTTGEHTRLAAEAKDTVTRLRRHATVPVIAGFGIGTPELATEICAEADGVAVGSALVRELLDGGGTAAVAERVRGFRAALDRVA